MVEFMAVVATGSPPSTIAQEPTERKSKLAIALDSSRLHDEPLVRTDTTMDAAIRALLCVEARAAVNRGQLTRPGRQWVLAHGHRCRDERLLFDAFGF